LLLHWRFFTSVDVCPIKELISEEKPPLYEDFLVADYFAKYLSRPLDNTGLDLFRL